jgi:Fe(3+) dicitrate transport protein
MSANFSFRPISALLLAGLAASVAPALNANPQLKEVLIIGGKDQAKAIPGSAYVIDEKEMEKFAYSDINRVLAQVPGIYLRDEDGQGLRPNIGIRGSGSDRNKKVTVMEDAVLAAPAPYSDPAAYYFPTTGRINSVEVLKGPSVLRYGPYTVGGAINLVSIPIPQLASGEVVAEVAENNEYRVHASYGGMGEIFGMLLEADQYESDGFMNLDNTDHDSGFNKTDYMAKFRVQTPSTTKLPQRLDVKFIYADETSDIGYLGLADDDFENSKNRRYGLSSKDEMDNHYTSSSAAYGISPNDNLALNITTYYNVFKRDWFRVDKVAGTSISNLFSPDNGVNSGNYASELAILRGADTTGSQLIESKHNDRDYYSKGVQFSADWRVNTGSIEHQVDSGIRFHKDEMDRYQPVERYSQINGQLVYVDTVPTVLDTNDATQSADVISLWAMDVISVTETVDITVSARREQIDAKVDRAALTVDQPQISLSQDTDKNLLGLGATWQLTTQWQLLAGVHDGFAPVALGPTTENDPETSTNYEAGARFTEGAFNAELIGFYSDYNSSVQNCSDASPCKVDVVTLNTGSLQLGESEVKGLEASSNYTLEAMGLQWPLLASWTWTEAEITQGNEAGSILDGDTLPYIPKNQLYARVGVVADNGWDAYIAAKYVDETCIDYKCDRNGIDNSYSETDNLTVVDFITHYAISDDLVTYFKVDNVFDQQRITIRNPAGIRTNKPRTSIVGIKYQF